MDFDLKNVNVVSLALLKFKTQKCLAERLGVSKQTISMWKHKRVSAGRVNDFSDATGIPRSLIRPDLYPEAKEL